MDEKSTTKALAEANARAAEMVAELERFKAVAVDRELKMIELKKKLAQAQEELARLRKR